MRNIDNGKISLLLNIFLENLTEPPSIQRNVRKNNMKNFVFD